MPVDRTVSLFSVRRVEEEVDVLFLLSGNFRKIRVRTDPPLSTCPLEVEGRLLEFNPDEPDWKRVWDYREQFFVDFGAKEYRCKLVSEEGRFQGSLSGGRSKGQTSDRSEQDSSLRSE